MVREQHTLLTNAKAEKPNVLVGHSFGGALVRLYARDCPNEVVGMALVDSAQFDMAHQAALRRGKHILVRVDEESASNGL